MSKIMFHGREIHIVKESEQVDLSRLNDLDAKLIRLEELIEQYKEIVDPRTITIYVDYLGAQENVEFSYTVKEGPLQDGYSIAMPLRTRYRVSVTDSGDEEGLWRIIDYRLDPAPASWDLGNNKGYGPVSHGNPAPHRFDFTKEDTAFSLNVELT